MNNVEKIKEKQAYNNLFLMTMIVSYIQYQDLSFFDHYVDKFISSNLLFPKEIMIDVDLFFLVIFGYQDKANTLIQKHSEYFKSIILPYKELESVLFFK